MSGQFVTGSCAQNSQINPPRPTGLKVGSSTLSGRNNAKLPAELFLEGAALRPRGEAAPGRRKPGGDRRAVLPGPLAGLPRGTAHFRG